MFSFHATKVFNTIEGGDVTFKDNKLNELLNQLENSETIGPEYVEYVCGNGKMNEFQATMGLCNIKNVDREIKKRKSVVERYVENLDGIEGIVLSENQKGIKHNYSYFPIVFNNYKFSRD